MSKKRVLVAFLVLTLVFSGAAIETYAKGMGGHGKKGLKEKFSCKAHMILVNKEELGLSDNQVKKIKDLKLKTKKDVIRKKAEIDILALDIKMAMYGDTIDTDAVNKLIDKKYEIKKEKTKSLVAAYATLKDTLTDDQKAKLKDIYKKCKKK
ncbi:MAG: Spy/CpxP family protein refolding chaperone [Candidatus Omnitrophica bacterium]|nr:Spy/CpxP family protein refolding chaperone [Candidatus Omnitrophota bacterium]